MYKINRILFGKHSTNACKHLGEIAQIGFIDGFKQGGG